MRYIYIRKHFSRCAACDFRVSCALASIPPCTADTIMERATCSDCKLLGRPGCPDYGKLLPARSFPCENYAGPNDYELV